MSTYSGLLPIYHIVLKDSVKAMVGAFSREKALAGAFSVIVKTSPMVRLQL